MRLSEFTAGHSIYALTSGVALVLSLAVPAPAQSTPVTLETALEPATALSLPEPKMPEPNAWDFYLRAGKTESALDDGALDYALQTQEPIRVKSKGKTITRAVTEADKDAYLQRREEALRLFREGMQHESRHPAVRSTEDVPFPEYARLRELGRMLMVMSRLQGERGNWENAATTALDILYLGHDVTRGANLTGSIVGRTLQSMGRKPLQSTLEHLDAAQSKAAARRLEQIMQRGATFGGVLEEEKRVGVALMLEIMQSPEWRKMRTAKSAADVDSKALGLKNRKEVETLQAISDRQIIAAHLAYMDAQIANARLPYNMPKSPPPVADDPLNKIFAVPNLYAKVRASDEINRAQNSLLVVTLALRAYHLESGRYPATLNELVPHFLGAVPLDPFDDAPLRYRRDGASYLLYSIGPDGVDNNGRAVDEAGRNKARGNVNPDSKGDIVSVQTSLPRPAGNLS